MKQRNRKWEKKRLLEHTLWLKEIKELSGCIDCNSKLPGSCYHFDHIKGIKLFNIGTANSLSRKRVLEEIKKCEIVCANCHGIRTFLRDKTRKFNNDIHSLKRYKNTQKIRDLKISIGCKDCGYKKHFAALQFDHLRDKIFNLSQPSARKWDSILKEIEKCEVVCANCHILRTLDRRGAYKYA